MSNLPLGLAVAVALMVAGCASKKDAPFLTPPPASPPVVAEKTVSDKSVVAKQQVTASARYVRVPGKLPEAKGSLAFFADETGLRKGAVTLTQEQAEAAMEELAQITHQDVRSTPKVTVLDGNPVKIICGALTPYVEDATVASVRITVGGVEQEFRAREVGVSLRLTPQILGDGAIQVDAEIQVTTFEGFVEYGGKSVAISSKPNVSGEVTETAGVKVPDTFYQPVFSTSSVQRELRIPKGAVVVLLADPVKNYASSTEGIEKGLKIPTLGRLKSEPETWLVFLTAAVSPIKR